MKASTCVRSVHDTETGRGHQPENGDPGVTRASSRDTLSIHHPPGNPPPQTLRARSFSARGTAGRQACCRATPPVCVRSGRSFLPSLPSSHLARSSGGSGHEGGMSCAAAGPSPGTPAGVPTGRPPGPATAATPHLRSPCPHWPPCHRNRPGRDRWRCHRGLGGPLRLSPTVSRARIPPAGRWQNDGAGVMGLTLESRRHVQPADGPWPGTRRLRDGQPGRHR